MKASAALKPLRIGPVQVDFPVMLASLAGYSDLIKEEIFMLP